VGNQWHTRLGGVYRLREGRHEVGAQWGGRGLDRCWRCSHGHPESGQAPLESPSLPEPRLPEICVAEIGVLAGRYYSRVDAGHASVVA